MNLGWIQESKDITEGLWSCGWPSPLSSSGRKQGQERDREPTEEHTASTWRPWRNSHLEIKLA